MLVRTADSTWYTHADNGVTNSKPTDQPELTGTNGAIAGDPPWIHKLVQHYPQMPFLAPFMVFLLLMVLDKICPDSWRSWTYLARSLGGLYTAWLFRRHYPSLGKMHLSVAIPIGIATTVMWVGVHNFLAGSHHAPIFGWDGFSGFDWYRQHVCFDRTQSSWFVPAEQYQSALALWTYLIIRIGGAALVVPIIEEIFWRAFLLRVLIDWERFEDVPYAKFTWFSFLGTSLLSAVSHQPQWEVGILCWLIYNGLYYWKRSLLCCMITHGITNFLLYTYVYAYQDWRFW